MDSVGVVPVYGRATPAATHTPIPRTLQSLVRLSHFVQCIHVSPRRAIYHGSVGLHAHACYAGWMGRGHLLRESLNILEVTHASPSGSKAEIWFSRRVVSRI